MLGYTREELVQHSPLEFTIGYNGRRIEDINREILAKGHSQFEAGRRNRNGEIIPVEINAHVIVLHGRTMMLSVVRDITERKQAVEALRQANSKLNLLSSITRHDINNQLFSLKAYLELSKLSLGDAAKMSEYIIREERAANAIQRQILFTKEYEDMGVKTSIWHDVDACVRKVQASLPMRDIRVIIDSPDIEVYADPLFEKVFYNLIDNALRYGGPNMTRIRVSAQESEKGLVISVEDDGTGISVEGKKRLFERGFGHNTGLGLFLSREVLSITGIMIAETSEPGKGARFEITVPKGEYRFFRRQVRERGYPGCPYNKRRSLPGKKIVRNTSLGRKDHNVMAGPGISRSSHP